VRPPAVPSSLFDRYRHQARAAHFNMRVYLSRINCMRVERTIGSKHGE